MTEIEENTSILYVCMGHTITVIATDRGDLIEIAIGDNSLMYVSGSRFNSSVTRELSAILQ